MKFTKMHGAGNDFIIINNIEEKLPASSFSHLAKTLCAFHSSIGADGMMVVTEPKGDADYAMQFYNSDGSMGEMCGNGARCIARYGYENGLAGEIQRVETTAGLVIGERIDKRLYRIRLNDPTVLELSRLVDIEGESYDCSYVELGCPGIPHVVLIKEDFDSIDRDELRSLGRKLRFAKEFPKGANVSFVKLVGEDKVEAITFERGVEDFTLACGTGCGSIVSALSLKGLVSGNNVSVTMPGGELFVSITAENGMAKDVFLTGPTCIVCKGEVLDEDL